MAEFKGIQLKRSTTAGAVPEAAQLVEGELALNLVDKKLYSKNSAGVFQVKGDIEDNSIGYAKLTSAAVTTIIEDTTESLGNMAVQEPNAIAVTGGTMSGVTITTGSINGLTTTSLGTNSYGTKTVSVNPPSGGIDGDVWYKV